MVPDFTLHFLLTIAIDIEHAECLLEISNLLLAKISAGHDELKRAICLVLCLECSGPRRYLLLLLAIACWRLQKYCRARAQALSKMGSTPKNRFRNISHFAVFGLRAAG